MPDGSRSEILRTVRYAALAALLVTYALLVHHVNATGQASVLGATLALAPLMILGLALALRRESRTGGILLLAALGAAAWSSWAAIEQHSGLIFWLQDISLMLALFATFGRSLLAGRKPLCVGFAEAMHGGSLPSEHRRYATNVTIAWVIFFGAMATASTLLFFYAPLAAWSFFVNFLTLPLVALMFIAEYLLRRHMLPDAPAAHILAAVEAYRNMALRKH